LLEGARTSFREIGYRDDLLLSQYPFADILSRTDEIRTVPLAGFAQHPPSYKSAGFGILVGNGVAPHLSEFISLGAPHLFVVSLSENRIHRWKVTSQEPVHVQVFEADKFSDHIRANRHEFEPMSILRAKSASLKRRIEQLDFIDIGLIPALDQEVHRKLDILFGRTISSAVELYKEIYQHDPAENDYQELFRLVFRLVAAKLLADRQYPGEWLDSDVGVVLSKVNDFYFRTTKPEQIIESKAIQQQVWDSIRSGFRLHNLSSEALAQVYETTFVNEETRRIYNTHATPPEIAGHIVDKLPFEEIDDPFQRKVFEPFTGHAPFLTASLGRLRNLLPPEMVSKDRHSYFIEMLTGIESDPFAREIARSSLILADYPNPNGWRIEEADAFQSNKFQILLKQANIVLCNPPFGQFSKTEREKYTDLRSPNKAVDAILRVLEHAPRLLGFVLPRSFTDGRIYRKARKKLAEIYADISIIALPDNTFQFSEAETVLVLAVKRDISLRRWHRAYVSKSDLDQFKLWGKYTWEDEEIINTSFNIDDPPLWRHPLESKITELLKDNKTLKSVAEIHRGIEYVSSVSEQVSDEPMPGYKPGLHNVSDGLQPYTILNYKYLNLDPNLMRTGANKLPWEKTKVIANAARISRGPWRVVAAVDSSGLVCYQRFHAIWPMGSYPVQLIAAILNGPLANILLSIGSKTRDNLVRNIEGIPLPSLSQEDIESICSLVEEFNKACRSIFTGGTDSEEVQFSKLVTLSTQIDVSVLSGYGLPEDLEIEILDYIGHEERPFLKSSLVSQLRERHGELVDKSFSEGLNSAEKLELSRINRFLDSAEENYFRPIKARLFAIQKKLEGEGFKI